MKHRRSRRKQGFTFLESLISVFLLVCATTVFAASMPIATLGRTKAKYQQHATNFANKQIELARSLAYPNLYPEKLVQSGVIDSIEPVSANTFSCDSVDQAAGDRISDILPEGHSTFRIEQVDQELKRLTIKVTWVESGRTREFELGTLVANL